MRGRGPPTGSNAQNWEWVLVRDPDVKRRLARMNRQAWSVYGTLGRIILVAYDGSEGARRSLDVALALAGRIGAELHAVAVEGHLPHYGATVGEVQEELKVEKSQVARALADARSAAESAGVALKTEVVAGHPAQAIIEAAKAEKVDLIVMGHAGRSGVWGLLPGGTAERVSRHAPCSVLIVR